MCSRLAFRMGGSKPEARQHFDSSVPQATVVRWIAQTNERIVVRKTVILGAFTMSPSLCSILLIEEDPILREVTGFRLELLGYDVACCEGANKAHEWLQQQLPRLIVVGQVAEADSIEFLNQLSNEPRTSEIPVVVLSASSDLEDVQKAYNAGADEFLVTPYDPQVLENKVQGLIALTAPIKV